MRIHSMLCSSHCQGNQRLLKSFQAGPIDRSNQCLISKILGVGTLKAGSSDRWVWNTPQEGGGPSPRKTFENYNCKPLFLGHPDIIIHSFL